MDSLSKNSWVKRRSNTWQQITDTICSLQSKQQCVAGSPWWPCAAGSLKVWHCTSVILPSPRSLFCLGYKNNILTGGHWLNCDLNVQYMSLNDFITSMFSSHDSKHRVVRDLDLNPVYHIFSAYNILAFRYSDRKYVLETNSVGGIAWKHASRLKY